MSPLSCENSRLQGDGLACTSQEPMYLFHAFTWAITFFAGTFGLGQSLKTIEVFNQKNASAVALSDDELVLMAGKGMPDFSSVYALHIGSVAEA